MKPIEKQADKAPIKEAPLKKSSTVIDKKMSQSQISECQDDKEECDRKKHRHKKNKSLSPILGMFSMGLGVKKKSTGPKISRKDREK